MIVRGTGLTITAPRVRDVSRLSHCPLCSGVGHLAKACCPLGISARQRHARALPLGLVGGRDSRTAVDCRSSRFNRE